MGHIRLQEGASVSLMLMDEAVSTLSPPRPTPALSMWYQHSKTEGGAVGVIVSLPIAHHKQIKFPVLPSGK